MTADALFFIQWFFQYIWKFFTDWKIPGTNATPVAWLLFLVLAGLVLSWIPKILSLPFKNE